ncbi:MAG TPA: hypothetical protein GX707_02110 [Epulopiscium sp.]|nr:hypothetical protein [Candidatus Epulonipiscium sp.]
MRNHHIKQNANGFFEGWYFKHQSFDKTISFIPGVHIPKNGRPFAFIQIITNDQSYFIKYPFSQFYAAKNSLYIKIGNNIFSKKGISVSITTPKINIQGKISYGPFTPIKYDIMGPFSLIPNMECNHGIISMGHSTHGYLKINNETINFHMGNGYIEKDWGSSFPNSYTWIQCNDFKDKTSIVLSIAHIPSYGFSFRGLIAIVYYKGKEYRFATYNGGKILYANEGQLLLKRGCYSLRITVPKGYGYPLKAPDLGHMSRIIHERPSCPATFEFFTGKTKLFTKHSPYASFEYVKAYDSH